MADYPQQKAIWPRVWEAWARQPFPPGAIWIALQTSRLPVLSRNLALLSVTRLVFGPCYQEFFIPGQLSEEQPADCPCGYSRLRESTWSSVLHSGPGFGWKRRIVARAPRGLGVWSHSLQLSLLLSKMWLIIPIPALFPQVIIMRQEGAHVKGTVLILKPPQMQGTHSEGRC